jgi:hypothetical protein
LGKNLEPYFKKRENAPKNKTLAVSNGSIENISAKIFETGDDGIVFIYTI